MKMIVLGVIGKILLCTLFGILVLLLLLLFVPVCYRVEGRVEDPTPHEEWTLEQTLRGKGTAAAFHFSWLFSFVRGGVSWPDKPAFEVYVLWLRVFPGHRDSPSGRKGDREKGNGEDPAPAEEDNYGKQADSADRLSLPSICAKIKAVWSKLRRFIRILRNENTKSAVHKTAYHTAKIVRRLLPRHYTIAGTVGLGDPGRAGAMLAILGMLYPVTGNCVQIQPEFMAYQIDLYGKAKGRVSLISVVTAAVSLLTDRSVRMTLRRLKEIKKHG